MSESKAVRITLRIEFADGVVCEFQVEHPYQFDLTLTHPDWTLGARLPLRGTSLDVFPAFAPVALEFSLKAGHAHPITMQSRRQAIEEAKPQMGARNPRIHLWLPYEHPRAPRTACGTPTQGQGNARSIAGADQVTCQGCIRTIAYKAAMAAI